jgi:NADH-quinone oxidoreductase subunit H
MPEELRQFVGSFIGSGNLTNIVTSLIFLGSFCAKVAFFLWIFIWVRWTLPRFRYDRLMDLGWKTLLPWAIANTVITATILFIVNF